MVKNEYLRFMQYLGTRKVSSNVLKIANLVLQHLDTLQPLSTAQGQRIKKVVTLAQGHWNLICADIDSIKIRPTERTDPIEQLNSLSVGPFRGFSREEIFDLSSKTVLIYGPNGTGKSSFCEALEHALLGNIAEANARRFNPTDYLKNAHTNSYEPPVLIGRDAQGNDVTITENEALYRFCFIEKNCIDNFSRITAQGPAKQTELISTLFGLDAFSEFVRNFTETLDQRYIDLEGVKKNELDKKRQVLAATEQQLKSNQEESVKITDEQKALAEVYRSGYTFAQMKDQLNGSEEKKGLIAQLDEELQKPIAIKSNLTVGGLESLYECIHGKIIELNTKKDKLTEVNEQVSFKELYEAITKLQAYKLDHCPACQTPIEQVKSNPFVYAKTEIPKLQELSTLQETIESLQKELAKFLRALSQQVSKCCTLLPINNKLSDFQVVDESNATIDWWNSLHQKLEDASIPWQYLKNKVKQFEEADKEIERANQRRSENQDKLAKFRGFQENIIKFEARRESSRKAIKDNQDTINKFKQDNAKLIAEVETEKAIIIQNQYIATAYENFAKELRGYVHSLPAQLVADLGELVVRLYNDFNRNDPEHEKLTSVRLPLFQNQKLEISFRRNPDKPFDALQILSEGHIRCIGLAILTAKNIKENCPFLIFDDPVNAIDDEHREGIRKTLFEDDLFKHKQIILACHGEEFFKDIQNMMARQITSKFKSFSFLPKADYHHIRVDFQCSPRNYILKARAHFDKNEIRDTLAKSRQALENLSKNKIWSYLSEYGDGYLSIKLRSPSAPMELRNLTEQLKTRIAADSFLHPKKNEILAPLNTLLGIDGASLEWRYLNKGTHDESDRTEFEQGTVKIILETIEQLDNVIHDIA